MNHDYRFVAQHRVNERIKLEYRCRCRESFLMWGGEQSSTYVADNAQVVEYVNGLTPCYGAPNAPHMALKVLSAPHDAGRLWLRR